MVNKKWSCPVLAIDISPWARWSRYGKEAAFERFTVAMVIEIDELHGPDLVKPFGYPFICQVEQVY